MAKGNKKTIGLLILQIVLAFYLLVSGILAYQMVAKPQNLGNWFQKQGQAITNGGSNLTSVYNVLDSKDAAKTIVIILGTCEAIAGAFLILALAIPLGKLENIGYLFSIIIWACVMLFANILGSGGIIHIASDNMYTAMSILSSIGINGIVLAGLIAVKK